MIDLESLRPLVKELYRIDTENVGRRDINEIIMLNTLFLLSTLSYSYEIMDRGLLDRISFRNLSHYPEMIPDSRTIWFLRKKLSSTRKEGSY